MVKFQSSGALTPCSTATTSLVTMTRITKPLPPLELLEELFEVSKDSPSGLIWKNPRSRRVKSGEVAGWKGSQGYWSVGIKTDKDRVYKVHRIIYYMQTGKEPGELFIDHISDVSNNLDIRIATRSQNGANRKKSLRMKGKTCSSTFKGVSWCKRYKKWLAYLFFNKKVKHIGYFKDEKKAAQAYNEAAIKYFGEFAKLNRVE